MFINFLTVMFNCESDNSFQNQEEEWESVEFHCKEEIDSSEKEQENYLEKYFTEDKLFFSNIQTMRHYRKAHGVTDEDVMHFENEVEDMKQAVKKLQNTLSLDRRPFEVLGVGTIGEEEERKKMNREENENAAFEEIEKMDAILRVKAVEEKKAKLCRIEAEEESRGILSSLPRVQVSNGVKINMEEFLKLLNDTDETEFDNSRFQNFKQENGSENNEKINDCDLEGNKVKGRNNGQRNTKNVKFIEKNIQLAKYGRGTLSMTDEEKSRIEELLSEADESFSKAPTVPTGDPCGDVRGDVRGDMYTVDDEAIVQLSRIDQRLEVVAKAPSTQHFRRTESLVKNLSVEENACERAVKLGTKNSGANERKRVGGVRLEDIDHLLSQFHSVCHEEICPLSEEELENLVEESKQEEEEKESGEAKTGDGLSVRCSEDVISELVLNAKLLMPRFKYRFNES